MKKIKLSQRILSFILLKSDKTNNDIYNFVKKKLFKGLKGSVVELGPGTGLNLDYYPKDICWIGIEPNSLLRNEIRKRANNLGMLNVLVKDSVAEKIPLKDNNVDFVVSTLMLCSVKDLKKTLSEIKRILKKGGKFLFIEHVAGSRKSFRRKFQNFLTKSPYMLVSDGCHPNRDIGERIENAGFGKVEYSKFIQFKNRSIFDRFFMYPINPHIYGVAIK